MDIHLVRIRLGFILNHVRASRTATDPFARAEQGLRAVNRIIDLMDAIDADLDALPAAQAAADAARTACREHLYSRSQPCVHDDDGQEEQGMGEPSAVPAPWKSPD